MAKCDECAARDARTAAGPAPMPPGPPAQDKAGPGAGSDDAWKASIEERVAALENAVMQSQMAALDAAAVDISAYVNS